MKLSLAILLSALSAAALIAQPTPRTINYQAVARDGSNAVLSNRSISVRFTLLRGSPTGTAVYSETHNSRTSALGLFSLPFGGGTVVSGAFNGIDWATADHYLKSEVDPQGGTNYVVVGVSKMLAVPYAIVADSARAISAGATIVTSVNTLSGAVTIVGGGGTTVTKSNGEIVISSAGGNGGSGIQGIQSPGSTLTITNPNGPVASIDLDSVGTPGTYTKVTTDAYGRVTAGANLAASDVPSIPESQVTNLVDDLASKATVAGTWSTTGNSGTKGATNFLGNIDSMDLMFRVNNVLSGTISPGWPWNAAFGYGVLRNNLPNISQKGCYNTAMGYAALLSNNLGRLNTAIGYNSLTSNLGGEANTAVGCLSLRSNTTAHNNTALGYNALTASSIGASNTALGSEAMKSNTEGGNNTGAGAHALYLNTTGANNTAVGYGASAYNTTGNGNTSHGYYSLYNTGTGSNNTAVGDSALLKNTSGSNNTAVGAGATVTTGDLTNVTVLGAGALSGYSNSVVLGNTSVTGLWCQGAYASTTSGTANMYVGPGGQIMRSTSSGRYKRDVHDLEINTENIYSLQPRSYISRIDGKKYFGLVAEEVAAVIPELAEYARSKDVVPGSTSEAMIPDAVQYPMLSVLLLNELKKEHATVEELRRQHEMQERTIRELLNRVNTLEENIPSSYPR